MAKSILDLFNEYNDGYNKLLKKKQDLMRNEEKHKDKIKKINEKIMKHQMKYINLFAGGDITKAKEESKDEQS